jgi:hypothetical protein
MLIVPAGVVEDEGLGLMKQEDAAQHVIPAEVVDKIGMGARIPNRQAEMVIVKAQVVRHARAGSGEHKHPGFAVPAYLVVEKGRPAVGTGDDYTRENTLGRAALGDRA